MVVAMVLGAGILAACAPPKPGGSASTGGGREIIEVHPQSPGPYQTVTQNGVEYLQARSPVGQFGGTLYQNSIGDGPKSFNNWASYDATSSGLSGMLVSGLTTDDAYTGEVDPYLAKSVTISPDKLTYTVVLRKGLQWSDGQPLTSKDVVFTWNEIIGKGLGNPSSRDSNLVDGKFPEVKALDDLTIEFKTAKPFSPFMRNLGEPIAPEHVFAPIIAKGGDRAFSDAWGTSEASQHPEHFVSSGMWLLDSYDISDQRVVFKRNPKFFMIDKAGNHLPYLDKQVTSFVKDLNNEHLQFQQGKADIYSVPGDLVATTRTMKTDFDFKLYDLGPDSGTTFVTFNLNTRKNQKTGKSFVDPVKSFWFTNTKFRQAIDWAINRQDMVDNILRGVGAPLYTEESLASIFLDKDLANGHPQDIEKAKSLLKEGRFTWDAQGNLLDAKGRKVEFDLYTNAGNTERESTLTNIQQDLQKLGMKVNPKAIEFNVLVGKLNSGDWEAVVMGLTGSPLEPNSGANIWKSDGGLHMFNQRDVKKPPVDLSDRFPWETQIDDLMSQGAQTFGTDERRKVYDKLQEVVYEQQPFIYLYSQKQIIAVKSRLQNIDPTPLGGVLHNMESIWVKDDKK